MSFDYPFLRFEVRLNFSAFCFLHDAESAEVPRDVLVAFEAQGLLSAQRDATGEKHVDFYCLSYTCCVFTSFPSIFALVFTVTLFPSGEMAVQTVPIFAPPFFNTPVIL